MADTGWISCASYAQRAGSGDVEWTPTSGTTELASSDNSRVATAVELTDNASRDSTNDLLCAFGTAIAANVPSGAQIDGVSVSVEGVYSGKAAPLLCALHSDSSGTLVSGTAPESNSALGFGSTSNENTVTFGGATSLFGAGSIADTAIRSSDLRVAVYVDAYTESSRSTLYIDQVRVRVYYTYVPPPQSSAALFWSAP